MFRNQLSAEIILGFFCLLSGVLTVGFVTLVTGVLDNSLEENLQYMNWEDLTFLGLFLLIGLLAIACSYGLFKHQRWAVIFMSLIFLSTMLLAAIAIVGERDYLLRKPIQTVIAILGGVGLPLCFLLLFNSTRVFPWLTRPADQEEDVLDRL